MNLSEKIITYRKRDGLSQETLAEKLGVSRQAVSKWETGESLPEIDKITQMAKIFGVSTDDLLLDEEPSHQSAGSGGPRFEIRQERSAANRILDLIKRHGWLSGFIISAYGFAGFLVARLAHYMFSRMLNSFNDPYFSSQTNGMISLPIDFTNIVSIACLVITAAGIVIALVIRHRTK
ncbi:MAG: helix-turn-helix transcriptional regulator [Oscillospiraceae bacterium]